MSVPVIAFFNNKGGVGKTSLVYHLTWMFSDLGTPVIAADLDPQANLTAAFLDEEQVEQLWTREPRPTVYEAIRPLITGYGGLGEAHVEKVTENAGLVIGDLELSRFEADLSNEWNQLSSRSAERAYNFTSVFWRLAQSAAQRHQAEFVLMDLGPNLGAINRSALIGADYLVVPLAPDLFSLQGLRNLGPTFDEWRETWSGGSSARLKLPFDLPPGKIHPIGYVVLQHAERLSRPTIAYKKWADRIPDEYRRHILGSEEATSYTINDDPENLASLKHYRSLMPMAQEARKPIFHLRPADGAIGAHAKSVHDAYGDFKRLALRIGERAGIQVPSTV